MRVAAAVWTAAAGGVTGGFRQRAEDRRPDVGAELMGLVQGQASASESGEIQIPCANRIDAQAVRR